MGVFLVIERAFNGISYDFMCAALFKLGVDYTIIQWIRTTLEGRLAAATLGGFSKMIAVPSLAHREVCCRRSYGVLMMI